MKSRTRLILLSVVWAIDAILIVASMFLGVFGVIPITERLNLCYLFQGIMLIVVTFSWVDAFFEYRRELTEAEKETDKA